MESIRCEFRDRVAWVTLDDGKANAMNFAFFEQLERALDAVEKSDACLVVLSGRTGFFSGGLDLKLMPTLTRERVGELATAFARASLRLFALPRPTVALCTGHAIAGGAMLALCCDRRYALDGPFRFHLNETIIGIPLPSWMIAVGQLTLPTQWQTELLLLARPCTPREAVERGVYHALVENGQQAMELGRDLMGLNLPCYGETKRRMRQQLVERSLEILTRELFGS